MARLPRHRPRAVERALATGEGSMLEVGVFIPIANNGYLISTTAPQYSPSFAHNRDVLQAAERHGFDFALAMIKLRGYGGPTHHREECLRAFPPLAGRPPGARRPP